MRSQCIDCVIRGIDVAVPASEVVRFVRHRPSPALPMAQPWVAGLAVEAGEVLLCLSPVGRDDSSVGSGRGGAEGVALLMRGTVGGLNWALEVDRPGARTTVEVQSDAPMPVSGWSFPSDWFRRATSPDGRELAWFDVRAAMRGMELAGSSRVG